MPPRSKSQGESKQSLIITLVFFILATIGLGVATYYGFAGQEALEKNAKKAEGERDVFKTDRDWYRFQAMMLRSYIGQAQGMADVDQLGTLKGQFDNGSLSGMKSAKDKEDVVKVLKALEERFKWNGNQATKTYEDVIAKAQNDYNALAALNQASLKAKEKAQKDLETKDGELKSAKDDYNANLKKLEATLREDFVKSDKDLDAVRAQFVTLTEASKADLKKLEDEKNVLRAEITSRDATIATLKSAVNTKQAVIDQFNINHPETPASMRTDWKIVEIDRRGSNPYINLGSADRVKPQLTFTIHGITSDGRVNPQAKGTLEVVNVIGAHLSQTRVTSLVDRDRDPILKGDIIYNSSWNPTIPKHVAIAGIIDLTGDGRDSLREFMRTLERQNIIVDAYLDLKDGNVKGKGITYRTDYLIVGDTPEVPKDAKVGPRDIVGQRTKMENDAKKYGVQTVGLYRYLDMIGYRLPRGNGAERPSLYNPELRPDQAPRVGGDAAPPPMKPDK